MGSHIICLTVKDIIKLGGLPKTMILQSLWKKMQDQNDSSSDESAPDEPAAEPPGDTSD